MAKVGNLQKGYVGKLDENVQRVITLTVGANYKVMTCIRRVLSVIATLLLVLSEADAQKTFKLNRFVDSLLSERYWHADIDTNYITRPKTKWTVMGQFNVSRSQIKMEGQDDTGYHEIEMMPDTKSALSVNVSYVGVSLSLSINPAKLLGKYKDSELSFRSYGRRFGFGMTFQDANNFKGEYKNNDKQNDFITNENAVKLKTLNMNAYYVFNPRRFSYSAAFSHNYIQLRSAGSFMLAASFQGQQGEFNGNGLSAEFKMSNIGIGAGYGYNYVPARGWLLHISALPTIIVYSKTTLSDNNGSNESLPRHFPEYIITTRAAVVKQIGSNKFAGFSTVYNLTRIGHDHELSFRNYKWISRLYFGFRF